MHRTVGGSQSKKRKHTVNPTLGSQENAQTDGWEAGILGERKGLKGRRDRILGVVKLSLMVQEGHTHTHTHTLAQACMPAHIEYIKPRRNPNINPGLGKIRICP